MLMKMMQTEGHSNKLSCHNRDADKSYSLHDASKQPAPTEDSTAARSVSTPPQRGDTSLVIKCAVVTLLAPYSTETYGNYSI